MELILLLCVLLSLHAVVLCLRLRRVVLGHPALALSFVLRFGGAFPLLKIRISKVSLLLFKLLLDLDSVSVGDSKREDVKELHLVLDVFVETIVVLEYHMPLRILDTQLRAKGMKNICELDHILVPFMP